MRSNCLLWSARRYAGLVLAWLRAGRPDQRPVWCLLPSRSRPWWSMHWQVEFSMTDRRAIPAAVAATLLVPAAAQAQGNPWQQIEYLTAQLNAALARVAALESWRAGVEAVWPNKEN